MKPKSQSSPAAEPVPAAAQPRAPPADARRAIRRAPPADPQIGNDRAECVYLPLLRIGNGGYRAPRTGAAVEDFYARVSQNEALIWPSKGHP